VSRIAEASALAGCAVPDNPRVNWTKERETAERLLSGSAPEPVIATPLEAVDVTASKALSSTEVDAVHVTAAEAARVTAAAPVSVTPAHEVSSRAVDAVFSPPSVPAATPAFDSIDQLFSWPPAFDLDAIDLSNDPNARDFRRPRAKMQRRVEFDDQTASHRRQMRHEPTGTPSPAPRVTASSVAHGDTTASSRARTPREAVRAEAPRGTARRVVIAAALIVLLASAALLMYLLQHREAASAPAAVQRLASSASSTFYIAVGLATAGLGCLLWDFLWSRHSSTFDPNKRH
jgi:hypothetical protein